MSRDTAIQQQFWSNASLQSSGCWEWHGIRQCEGYGVFYVPVSSATALWPKGQYRAHRLSYMLSRNEPAIPKGYCVCHHCDNPSCVRPDHLFLGTHRDNTLDAVRKGRWHNARKTHCPAGHPYSGQNLLVSRVKSTGGTKRVCVECVRARSKRA